MNLINSLNVVAKTHKLQTTWSPIAAKLIQNMHSITPMGDYKYAMFFELLRLTHKLSGSESLFKNYLKQIFKDYNATWIEEGCDDIEEVISAFQLTRNDSKELELPSYSDFKKQTILNRIRK